MGWVIVLVVLVILGCVPLGFNLIFNVSGFKVDFIPKLFKASEISSAIFIFSSFSYVF